MKGSINLFEVMDEYDCKKIVFSSSANVYGHSKNSYISEFDKLKPLNP